MRQRLEVAIFRVFDAVLFAALWAVFVDSTLDEVRERAYVTPYVPPSHPVSPSQAAFLYHEEKSADEHVYDKVKQLFVLTIAAAAYLNKEPAGPISAVLALPLIAVIVICAANLSIRSVSVPDYSDAAQDPTERQWASDVAKATHLNRGQGAFRTDLYRAALRWLIVAFLLIMTTSAVNSVGGLSAILRSVKIVNKGGWALMEQVASLLKSIGWNWNAIIAVGTWALVLANIWLVWSQNRISRDDLKVRIHLEMEAEFDSTTMKEKRVHLATQLLSKAKHEEIQDDVANFFESLGALHRKKLLDDDLLWNTFSYYASRWWTALEPYILEERTRKGEQQRGVTFFVEFERLAAHLYTLEARRLKCPLSQVRPDEERKREFLEEERELK